MLCLLYLSPCLCFASSYAQGYEISEDEIKLSLDDFKGLYGGSSIECVSLSSSHPLLGIRLSVGWTTHPRGHPRGRCATRGALTFLRWVLAARRGSTSRPRCTGETRFTSSTRTRRRLGSRR